MDKAQNTPPAPATLNEQDAARYIGLSVPFLRQSRCNGNLPGRTTAPPFLKIGRAVRYLKADLDSWLEENRVEFHRAEG